MATTKFDVGGYKLAAEISGEGSPTVVFISGAGGAGDSWNAVISELRSSTALLTYARAGIGDSEVPPGPAVRTLGAAAEELHLLLEATGLAGPFILVGHSLGALIALIFAAQRPVAGLVLVDASDIHLNLDIDKPIPFAPDGDHLSYDVVAGVDEVTRSRRALDLPSVVIASRVRHWPDLTDLTPWRPFTLADLDNRWQHHQQSLATDLGATLKIARSAGHDIPNDAPTLVGEAIDNLIAAARRR